MTELSSEQLEEIGADQHVAYDHLGQFMHQNIGVARAIVAGLPEPVDDGDAVARTVAVFQWLKMSQYPELSLYRDPAGEHCKVQLGVPEALISSSIINNAGTGGRWQLLAEEDLSAAVQMGELYSVAHGRPSWLDAIHKAEVAYYDAHPYWLVARIGLWHNETHVFDDGHNVVTELHNEGWEGFSDYIRLPFMLRYDSHQENSPLLDKFKTGEQTTRQTLLRQIPSEIKRENWVEHAKLQVSLHGSSPERTATLHAQRLNDSTPKTLMGSGRRL